MNQEVLFQFSGDWSKFDREAQQRDQVIKNLQASASRISFGNPNSAASNYQSFKQELGGINTSLSGMKTRLTAIKQPLNDLNRIIITSTDLINKYDKEVEKLVKDLYALVNSMRVVEAQASTTNRNISALNKTTKEFGNTADGAGTNAKKLGSDVNEVSGFFGHMGGSIQRLIPFLSALFVINTVKDFLVQLYEINRQFELFELKAKSALYGSKLLVQEYYEILKRIDLVSLFDIEELEEGLVKLLNRRVNLTEQQLLSLANTAQSVGTKGAQSFNQIVDALLDAQVGQFRRLEELGVGVDATGEKLKLTFAGVTTEVDKGTKAIVDYILQMDKMNGATNFANEASTTLEGKISSLKTKFDELILAMGKAGAIDFFEFLIEDAEKFLNIINQMVVGFNRIISLTNQISNFGRDFFINNPKIGAIISPIGSIIDRLTRPVGLQDVNAPSTATAKEIENYKNTVTQKLAEVNREFKRLEFPGTVFQKEFSLDVSKLKTDQLKRYVTDLEAIIAQARKIGIGEETGDRGKALKETILNLNAIRAELTTRKEAPVADSSEIAKQERIAQRLLKIEQDALEAQRNLLERKLELEKKYLNDRLRFLEQGSVEYLQLKKEIDLKEIELDKQRSLEIVRASLVKRSINARGVEQVVNPTDNQVNARFKELGFENYYQDSRRQIEESTNEAIIDRRKNLYEKIDSALETALDRELRQISQKYSQIRVNVEKLQQDNLQTSQYEFIEGEVVRYKNATDDYVESVNERIEALEKLEVTLARLKRSQLTPEQAAKRTVRRPGESDTSFNIQRSLNSKQQEIENVTQLLTLIKQVPQSIANESFVTEQKVIFEQQLETLVADITALKERAATKLTVKDELLVKLFKIPTIPINDPSNPEKVLGISISDADRQQLEQFKRSLGDFANFYADFINSLIALEDKRAQNAEENIEALKGRIAEEQELRAKGLSNTTEELQKQLAEQQQIKYDAEQKQIALNKNMMIANLSLQGTELTLATARLFSKSALAGPLGIPAAIIGSLSMLAFFASAVSQIKSLSKFEKGGIIDFGNSHAKGGTVIEAEKGEFVVNKKTTSNNKTLVENINKFQNTITSKDLPSLLSNTGIYVNEESISNGKELLRKDTLIREHNILNTLNLEKEVGKLGTRLDVVAANTELLKVSKLMDAEGNIWIMSDNSIEKIKTKT